MKPLLSSKPEAASGRKAGADGAAGTGRGTGTGTGTPGPLASFARFVLCGGGIGVLSSGAVAGLALLMPWALSNALITIASTLLCTDLHARFTFGSGKHAGWRQHWQSAGSAAVAYAATCAAMFVLHLVQSSPSMLTEQVVYLSASGLTGLGRFLILRLFVFATAHDRAPTPTPVPQSPVRAPEIGGTASTAPGASPYRTAGRPVGVGRAALGRPVLGRPARLSAHRPARSVHGRSTGQLRRPRLRTVPLEAAARLGRLRHRPFTLRGRSMLGGGRPSRSVA